MESWRLSQDTAIPATSTIPSPCPEMLFIPQGGGTDAPWLGDFSAVVSIGATGTLTPGQKAPEMLCGNRCGFYVPTLSPAAWQGAVLPAGIWGAWEWVGHPHSRAVVGLGG